MALPQVKQHMKYSYAEYYTWDEGRWELIEGEVWNMTPAPLRRNQEISGVLFYKIYDFLKNNDCKVYSALFDVRLPGKNEVEDYEILTVVQPDIAIFCDANKLDAKGCVRAPELIVVKH